jgi:hypothetical protein
VGVLGVAEWGLSGVMALMITNLNIMRGNELQQFFNVFKPIIYVWPTIYVHDEDEHMANIKTF